MPPIRPAPFAFPSLTRGALTPGSLALGLLALTALGSAAPARAQAYRDAYQNGAIAAAAGRSDEAHGHFTRAAQGARAAGDADVEARARRVLAQIAYNRGARLAWAGRHDSALARFEAGIVQNPDYVRNHIGAGLSLDALARRDDAIAALKRGIEAGQRGDPDLAASAEATLRGLFTSTARTYVEAATPTRAGADVALRALDALELYLPADAASLYLRAAALLVMRQPLDASNAATRGLDLYRGSRDGAAGLHFVRGEALLALGDRAGARASFQQALYERFRTRAEQRLRELAR